MLKRHLVMYYWSYGKERALQWFIEDYSKVTKKDIADLDSWLIGHFWLLKFLNPEIEEIINRTSDLVREGNSKLIDDLLDQQSKDVFYILQQAKESERKTRYIPNLLIYLSRKAKTVLDCVSSLDELIYERMPLN